MTKEQAKEIEDELTASTTSNEMATALLVADALDTILRDVDRRIRSVYAKHGVKELTKEQPCRVSRDPIWR